MDSSVPPLDGTCWNVVYSLPTSKRKHDGTLTLRYINGSVVKKIFLSDSNSLTLADRILRRTENVQPGSALTFDSPPGYVVWVDSVAEDLPSSSSPSIIPSRIGARVSSRASLATSNSSGIDLSCNGPGTVIGRKPVVIRKPALAPYRRPGRVIKSEHEFSSDEQGSCNLRRNLAETSDTTLKPSGICRTEQECDMDVEASISTRWVQPEAAEPTSICKTEQEYNLDEVYCSNLREFKADAAELNQKSSGIPDIEQECQSDETSFSNISKRTQAEVADLLSEEVENFLNTINFSVQDFWLGYKLYCFGYYSGCDVSKEQFLVSKMGRAVCRLHEDKVVLWGAKFDEAARQMWAMMEEYLKIYYDKDCTNLRVLMEEFDDVKELSISENGSLLLQLIQDDEYGTEHLYNRTRNVQIQSTNIFSQLRQRLNQVDSELGDLMKSHGEQENRNSGASESCGSIPAHSTAKYSTNRPKNKPKDIWGKLARPK